MKNRNNIVCMLAAGMVLFSCEKPIVVDRVNEGDYANVTTLTATLRDVPTRRTTSVVEMRQDPFQTTVAVTLPRAPKKGVDFTLSYDAAYLEVFKQYFGEFYLEQLYLL